MTNHRVGVLHWNAMAMTSRASNPDIHHKPFLAGGVPRPFSMCAIDKNRQTVLEIAHTMEAIPSWNQIGVWARIMVLMRLLKSMSN